MRSTTKTKTTIDYEGGWIKDCRNSVCLEEKFEEVSTFTAEELASKVLVVLNSVGYIPTLIKLGKPNKGTIGEIRIPVDYDGKEAMQNWHNSQK